LIRIGELDTPLVVLKVTVFLRKSPFAVEMVNTGVLRDGALTALSLMSRRATPPAVLQFAAIVRNRVGGVAGRSRVSARQMLPVVADGKSPGEAPPFLAKTKFAGIAMAMSEPPLEVVDHVAGIQFEFPKGEQPVAFAGCGPPMTSTLFWAASGAAPSSNVPPNKNNIRRFFMDWFSLN
jgi:hypothetical protein